MLKKIIINNFALIEECEIKFSPGLNIITGETGSGKSLLIEALGALLGARMSADSIRSGEYKCVIEAEFKLNMFSPAVQWLKAEGEEVYEDLILRREYLGSGRTRGFINDSPVAIKKLSELGSILVDLCGQHDNQRLFNIDNHLDFLDKYAGLSELRSETGELYNIYRSLLQKLKDLQSKREKQTELQERLNFSIKEIEAVDPSTGEDEQLSAEEKELEHGEQLLEFCFEAEEELDNKNEAVLPTLNLLQLKAERFGGFSEDFKNIYEDLTNSTASLEEALRTIVAFRSRFEFSAERLEEIRERLGALSSLKRKYGGSIDAVVEKLAVMKTELDSIGNMEKDIAGVSKELKKVKLSLKEKAQTLSKKRIQAVPKLKETLDRVLLELGFNYTDFNAQITSRSGNDLGIDGKNYGMSENGFDICEFIISTNHGEEPLPLKDIASGGEISRILLALESQIANAERPNALVFDEIDMGISGRIARKVGLKLYSAAKERQLLVVTHLPQIASLPGRHISVYKVEENGRAVSRFKELDSEGRVTEIASLLTTGESKGKGEAYARELLEAKDIAKV